MRHFRRIHLVGIIVAAALVAAAAVLIYQKRHLFLVLQTKGTIADSERSLMVFATVLSLFVVLPVLAMLFFIAWKYREGNHRAKHQPDWDHSRILESIWWGIPCAIIVVLAVVTWTSSHALDPFKPISASKPPMTIQVVALQWKWLFIYPEQGIATVNYVRFPEKTPVSFQITADAPMNSFWIPQLGGQVYAMAGMQTQLHLMADGVGSYKGSSANLSGSGFADMAFTADSLQDRDFDDWVRDVKAASRRLTPASYAELAKPNRDTTPINYASASDGLYGTVIDKYMTPGPTTTQDGSGAHTMNMQGIGHDAYQQ